MTIENISWSISMNECCRIRRGLNPLPPDYQYDVHLTEPPRSAHTETDRPEQTVLAFSYFRENFMLGWVEHEKSFITSGPEQTVQTQIRCHRAQHRFRFYIFHSSSKIKTHPQLCLGCFGFTQLQKGILLFQGGTSNEYPQHVFIKK